MAIHVAIEGYDSLEQIGVGGMAAVYKARKVSIDKVVAIKVLFPYLAGDVTFTDRFQREARAAASIQHDNIVNVIDFGNSDGSFFIVMEYYDGRTLESLMKERPGVPFEVAAQILLEVAYGLEAAHAKDIVHRDIKPANIIYTNQGGIKLADFGLAKKSDSVTMITQHGKVIGTPSYMSPEQAAGGAVGPASDIFSLGVVAYEMFGRRKPFEGNTYSDVIEKIQTVNPPAVTEINPLIEPEFARIVARMLAKDEEARYTNAAELIADMESAMEKCKITRDRRRLAAYIKDPDAYDAHSNEKAITNHLSRGTYYMQKGEGHLDEALLEFRRILYLDPGNERARKNLERIRKERGDSNRTVTIDAAAHAAVEGAIEPTHETIVRARARRGSPWVYAAGIVLVGATVAAALWASRGGGTTSSAAQHSEINSAAMSDLPLLTESPTATDSRETAPANPSVARLAAGATAAADSVQQPAGVAQSTPARKEPAKAEPEVTRKPSGRPVVEKKAAAPVRTGTLSVYFLGGVGEVTVNGKRLTQQPPFEGLVLAAGQYRVACRMSGDEAPREIEVEIAPDRETVVEYEIGGTPVATFTGQE